MNENAIQSIRQFIQSPLDEQLKTKAISALREIELASGGEITSPQTDRLLIAVRDIFPLQFPIDECNPRWKTPHQTYGLGYIISREIMLAETPTSAEDACRILADYFLDEFYEAVGKEPRRETLVWVESPGFYWQHDFEMRAKKVAMWMAFYIDPPVEIKNRMESEVPEGSPIKYITV